MSEELKACPFCGKSDIHIEQKGTFFWCECYDCGAISRDHHTLPGVNVLQSEDIARGYWNTRPIEDELTARIAELKVFINQLIEAGDAVINAEPMWIAEEDKWETLVKDWKECKR